VREAGTPRALCAVGVLAALWTVASWLSNGFALSFGPLRLTSHDPTRPLIITLLAAVAYLIAAGPRRVREDAARLAAALTPARLAATLAMAIGIIGIANNSWGAGASDSYAYVSQMDPLRGGSLKVSIAMAADVPWPNALHLHTLRLRRGRQ